MGVNVRRLAALDMALHGPRLILIEFAVGVVGCAVLGIFSVALGVRLLARGLTWQLFLGIALLWVALNYVPLLLHAIDIVRRGSARQEAAYELAHPEIVRRYSVLQMWLLVPFAMVIMALAQRGARG